MLPSDRRELRAVEHGVEVRRARAGAPLRADGGGTQLEGERQVGEHARHEVGRQRARRGLEARGAEGGGGGGQRVQQGLQLAEQGQAWWLKVEHPQLWAGLRRAPEAMVSFQAAQAALRGA